MSDPQIQHLEPNPDDSVDFDWNQVENETPAAHLADEISDRFEGRTIDPNLAIELAVLCAQPNPKGLHDQVDGAILFELIRSTLERVLSAPKPRLETACLLIAFGVRDSNKSSMRETAKREGVTPYAVSKRVREIADVFELPINTFNKSAKARETYKLTNGKRRRL